MASPFVQNGYQLCRTDTSCLQLKIDGRKTIVIYVLRAVKLAIASFQVTFENVSVSLMKEATKPTNGCRRFYLEKCNIQVPWQFLYCSSD